VHLEKICKNTFQGKKKLNLIIDDTLLNKNHSEWMQGTDKFFDSKTDTKITAYKLLVCMISDGQYHVPIASSYLYSKELTDTVREAFESKEDIIKRFVKQAKNLFPDVRFMILVDGLFSTKQFVGWCFENKLDVETRMHSNRVILFNDKKTTLKALLNNKWLCPKNNRTGRTFSGIWHNLPLQFTIERRIDRHGQDNFIFLVSTYQAAPRDHIKNYKNRWPIETFFRTAKQTLGLNDCQSIYLSIQHSHVSAIFLSYAIAQLEMKLYRLKNTEEAIRRFKRKNAIELEERFMRQIRGF
jgi:hypothetical protein